VSEEGRSLFGKPITPESFEIEAERARHGLSMNAARFRREGGGWHDWLELWRRDGEATDSPLLIDPCTMPTEAHDPAWLAQFTFSYDPARYPGPPVQPRGMARVRAYLESFRRDDDPVVITRSLRHQQRSARFFWPEEPEDERYVQMAAASCQPRRAPRL
jgi:hypothetical protein